MVKPVKAVLHEGFGGMGAPVGDALKLTDEQKEAIETALMEIRAKLPKKVM